MVTETSNIDAHPRAELAECVRRRPKLWTDVVNRNETHFRDNQTNRRPDTLCCGTVSKIGLAATEPFLRRKRLYVNTGRTANKFNNNNKHVRQQHITVTRI